MIVCILLAVGIVGFAAYFRHRLTDGHMHHVSIGFGIGNTLITNENTKRDYVRKVRSKSVSSWLAGWLVGWLV